MKTSNKLMRSLTVGGVLLTGAMLVAEGTRFADFAALTASAGPAADESQPITFGNPAFEQRSIVDRAAQLALGYPNSGSFDMILADEPERIDIAVRPVVRIEESD